MPPADTRPITARGRRWRIAAFCTLQSCALLAVVEAAVRLGGFDQPVAGAVLMGAGGLEDLLHKTDALLFFALRPNTTVKWQGAEVTTNSLGLRGREVEPKSEREFRVLSLGESSTFGAQVADDETYSARLEQLLQAADRSRRYTVINAGVSGYTSFQSLKYLEHLGLKLKPDLVLFYHEANDFLPAEVSDRELFASQTHAWHRNLAEWSATYRAISAFRVRRKVTALRADTRGDATEPDSSAHLALPAVAEEIGAGGGHRLRVSVVERRANLQALTQLCRAHAVQLVVIHPSYAQSQPHTCVLTEFCARAKVSMFDAFASLHPNGPGPREYFLDECHPTPEGHARLARDLFDFLEASHLLPSRPR